MLPPNHLSNHQPVRSAYQPPTSSTFLSEQISHQQPASSTFLSEQTSYQPPAKRTGCHMLGPVTTAQFYRHSKGIKMLTELCLQRSSTDTVWKKKGRSVN
jgi:hypothetical protein